MSPSPIRYEYSAAPTVINMSVSGQDAEVRIDVSATAVSTSAKVHPQDDAYHSGGERRHI